ncbi:FAD-dependent oxidoreductase [Bacillus horti]|uniref:2-polyprenyl-6-methoxyphenol hydroxylase-like FAD-dependent oxidoreductase n=1 Tax=Caldalkalibacillus horti TaxID=77523 RepID=A0ABT9VWI5_9BACI|nr:FAD dependent oxidoreductase [Bacillus horti]MDQ0165341.1 2-polyprenyl-6-methoxyphenol hydroxylase-like FAD-dependent oxidoreductase [Bacillus horti]
MKTERVIVIGGGIAGLFAAKVLSEFYQEVVIVDKDAFPDQPENRPGTPQAFQPHRLTPRGSLILERLFPGYIDDLLKYGAAPTLGKTTHLINPYGTMVMPGQNKDAVYSRALLEWVLRERIRTIAQIRFLGLNEVIQLLSTEDRSAITGVELMERSSGERKQHTIMADLVLDTSGRFSKMSNWLTELGYDVPKAETLKISLGYSTRRYRIPSDRTGELNVIRMEGDPVKASTTGVLSLIENNTVEMVIWNLGSRYPSINPEQFEQEVAQLASPLFAVALQGLEPLGNPRGYRVEELSRQHYEQMHRWPAGLLVMGDAFCQLDPVFGQGMTIAAIEAEALETSLRNQLNQPEPDFELRFLQQMQDNIEAAWWLNAVADLRWPGVEYPGEEPIKGLKFAQKYMDFVLKQSTEQANYEIYGLYWLVNSLFLSPSELFNSQMITSLLTAGGSEEDKQWFDEWVRESDQPLEERLNQHFPSFENASFASMDQLM